MNCDTQHLVIILIIIAFKIILFGLIVWSKVASKKQDKKISPDSVDNQDKKL